MMKSNKRNNAITDTLIGQGSTAEGKLNCEANLRIEGHFHGEIYCQGEVLVGGTGEARSNIHASKVVIAGKVIGDITTQGSLTITSTGQVIGNVHVVNLIILEGGLLNGGSKMEKAPISIVKDKVKKEIKSEAG
jgi:cytoskeletal protein CcmA (bactofilin family)